MCFHLYEVLEMADQSIVTADRWLSDEGKQRREGGEIIRKREKLWGVLDVLII